MSAAVQSPTRWTTDPRTDLLADSEPWRRLLGITLVAAGDAPDSVLGILHGMRCMGAGLERQGTRWRIVAGAMPAEEYDRDRAEWLMPRRAEIAGLLTRLEWQKGI